MRKSSKVHLVGMLGTGVRGLVPILTKRREEPILTKPGVGVKKIAKFESRKH